MERNIVVECGTKEIENESMHSFASEGTVRGGNENEPNMCVVETDPEPVSCAGGMAHDDKGCLQIGLGLLLGVPGVWL